MDLPVCLKSYDRIDQVLLVFVLSQLYNGASIPPAQWLRCALPADMG